MALLTTEDLTTIEEAHATLQAHCSASWAHLHNIKEVLSMYEVNHEHIETKLAAKAAVIALRAELVEAIAHIDSIKDTMPVDVTP